MNSTIPETMRAIETSQPGGPEVLRVGIRPTPRPGPGEILIEVAAAGVNRPDVAQRLGKYPPPPGASDIIGLEVAGRVVALGEGVLSPSLGDEVCALLSGGGYAEYAAVPAGQVLPRPKGVSLVEAAAIPETFFTVWTNVFERGQLKPGEIFLVHGGASGIGTTAIQLARAHGARVFATAGTEEKCAACRELGAERAINYKTEDFVEIVRQATDGRGVDVVLDMVGGDYVQRDMEAMAVEGRHVSIAFLKGAKVELNLAPMQIKHLTLTGSRLRHRGAEEKTRIAHALRAAAWPWIESGVVRPRIHATFPLEQAAEAHRMLESDVHIGKIVLLVKG